jgi:hypothetical protein
MNRHLLSSGAMAALAIIVAVTNRRAVAVDAAAEVDDAAHRARRTPVTENTGLPFAGTERTKDDAGAEVGVMHACGHDVHMGLGLEPRASWRHCES